MRRLTDRARYALMFLLAAMALLTASKLGPMLMEGLCKMQL